MLYLRLLLRHHSGQHGPHALPEDGNQLMVEILLYLALLADDQCVLSLRCGGGPVGHLRVLGVAGLGKSHDGIEYQLLHPLSDALLLGVSSVLWKK